MKILNKISSLWQDYMSAERAVLTKDYNLAIEHANQLLRLFQRNTNKAAIERKRNEFVESNNDSKDDDF